MERKKLTDMKSEWARRRALNRTARLEDFIYKDNSMNAPTPEETEREQEIAEELQYEHLMRYHKAKDLLTEAEYADTILKRVNWLEDLGYEGVDIQGYSKPISFNIALRTGYKKNVFKMFKTETERLKEIIEESSKYLFSPPSNN